MRLPRTLHWRKPAGAALVFLFFAGPLLPASARAVSQESEEIALATLITTDPGQQRAWMNHNSVLHLVARAKALDLANRGYFAHTDPDGYGPNYCVSMAGYQLPPSWLTDPDLNYIESLAAGYTTPQAAFTGWMNSPGHKTHVLAENSFFQAQNFYGVGHVYLPGSPYGHYWAFISAPPDYAAVLKGYLEWQFLKQTPLQIADSDLGDGWRWLPWLGYFSDTGLYPWIYHDRHGWLYWIQSDLGSAWFWDGAMSAHWWTTDTSYPNVYRFSPGGWLFYNSGVTPNRGFFNYSSYSWETW